MYNPERFLTEKLAAEVLAEFAWPAPYTLEDWQPDGIAIVFPRCTLMLSEGFEGEMAMHFLPEQTGVTDDLSVTHAIIALRELSDAASLPPPPALISDHSPGASLAKVKNGIRDLSTLVLTYLGPCLLGDFAWVAAYQELKTGHRRAP